MVKSRRELTQIAIIVIHQTSEIHNESTEFSEHSVALLSSLYFSIIPPLYSERRVHSTNASPVCIFLLLNSSRDSVVKAAIDITVNRAQVQQHGVSGEQITQNPRDFVLPPPPVPAAPPPPGKTR